LSETGTGYLRPTAVIAGDALLVADPGLAMVLAQAVLEKPLMANHHHGLWGYSGSTSSGRELTVQSTGIGGPSTAAVATELAGHGVRRAIRVGSATALNSQLAAGDLLVAEDGLGLDGISTALGIKRPVADPELTAALVAALGEPRTATVAGYDLPVAGAPAGRRDQWLAAGAAVADGETAPLLAAAERAGLRVAVALVIDGDADLVELGERAALALDQLG